MVHHPRKSRELQRGGIDGFSESPGIAGPCPEGPDHPACGKRGPDRPRQGERSRPRRPRGLAAPRPDRGGAGRARPRRQQQRERELGERPAGHRTAPEAGGSDPRRQDAVRDPGRLRPGGDGPAGRAGDGDVHEAGPWCCSCSCHGVRAPRSRACRRTRATASGAAPPGAVFRAGHRSGARADAQAGASADSDSGTGSRPRPARADASASSDGGAPSGADAAPRSGPDGRAAGSDSSRTHTGCAARRLLRGRSTDRGRAGGLLDPVPRLPDRQHHHLGPDGDHLGADDLPDDARGDERERPRARLRRSSRSWRSS